MFGNAAFILAALQHRWLLYQASNDWRGPSFIDGGNSQAMTSRLDEGLFQAPMPLLPGAPYVGF